MRIGFSIKYSFRKIFDAVISGGMVSVDDKRNTLDGKFFPLDIYQLPFINSPIRSKVGGGGKREKVIARTKLTDALSGIVLAPAQELCTCISFFYNHVFWFILKIIHLFSFFEKLLYHGPTVKLKALPVYTCFP